MRWFKTRKDKKIEELQAEIERKDKAIAERDSAMLWRNMTEVKMLHPQVLKFSKRINTRLGGGSVDFDYVKSEMVHEIAKHIFPYVVWKICSDNLIGDTTLYARICVAKEEGDGECM